MILLPKRGSGGLNKKQKEGFLFALVTVTKKDPKRIRKHTLRTAIKLDLNPGHNPLDYAKWGVLKNKINTTSHPNICSLKNAIEKEWNKIPEELILKACKSLRRCVDTIIEKKKKMTAVLNKY